MKVKTKFHVILLSMFLASTNCLTPLTYAQEQENGDTTETRAEVVAPLTKSPGLPGFPFMDTSLSFEERAADLVSRMTVEEKIAQMHAQRGGAIPRLGIPAYEWWNEAVHGVARMPNNQTATSFPVNLSMASTWNPDLVRKEAECISDEARGYFNEEDTYDVGLTFWCPTMNLSRDPRWGRNDESYGEDPFLTAAMAKEFVNGMQGDDDKYLKTAATLKHFAANDSEFNRHTGSSDFDERTLKEYYLKAFQDVVEETDVEVVMTSYNAVRGIPVSVNEELVDKLLRRTWGFDGHVVTDCGALRDVYGVDHLGRPCHSWSPEGWDTSVDGVFGAKETVAYALHTGVDLNCTWGPAVYLHNLGPSLEAGLIKEDDIDKALVRTFTTRMKTGEFDPVEDVPYSIVNGYTKAAQVQKPENLAATVETAQEALVLLKNETVDGKKVLPLNKEDVHNIVVVGERADSVQLGNYTGAQDPSLLRTPYKALQEYFGSDAKVSKLEVKSAEYLMNIRSITLNKTDGSKVVLQAKNGKLTGCKAEANNVGYIEANGNASIAFSNVDLRGVTSISAEVAGLRNSTLKTKIEIKIADLNASSVADISCGEEEDMNGWQDYKSYTGNMKAPQKDASVTLYVRLLDGRTEEELTLQLNEQDKATVQNADAVIVCVGTHGGDATEEKDLKSLTLPREQAKLVNTISQLNDNTITWMETVAPTRIDGAFDHTKALLWSSFNGQKQGTVLVKTIFGEINPSGKLPVTWYKNEEEVPNIADYAIRTNDSYAKEQGLKTQGEYKGRTYQYFTGEVSYPFGYGLSYTDFEYSNISIDSSSYTPNDTITVSVNVKNTGDKTGKEVVQAYVISPDAAENDRPKKRLKAFDKVELLPGETKKVTLEIPAEDLNFYDEAGNVVYDQGTYTLEVGKSSADESALTTTFNLSGNLDKKITDVTAIPSGHILDIKNPEKYITADVTAVYNDESEVDLTTSKPVYTSSNERVAVVDNNGKVTAVSGGIATITTSVTVNGQTKTDSYPVVVKEELSANNILVDGVSLEGFSPEKLEYQYMVKGNTIPEVSAEANEGMNVTIEQPTEENAYLAKVIITKDGLGGNTTYKIQFNRPIQSETITFADMSEEELKAKWTIEDEDDTNWEITGNGLQITTQTGDIYTGQKNGRNIFLLPAAGDYIAETHITYDLPPTKNYQQAAIMIYQDKDTYFKVSHEFNRIEMVKASYEINGKNTSIPTVSPVNGVTSVYLRVVKEGNHYTGYYKLNEEDAYQKLGEGDFEITDPKLALFATNSSNIPDKIKVSYENIKFTALKTIDKIEDMNKTVERGTTVDQLNLPTAVDATLSDDSTKTFLINWDTSNYDSSVAGDYKLVGTLQIEDEDISKNTNTTVVMNVTVVAPESRNIVSVERIPDRTVAVNATMQDVNLPTMVNVGLDDSTTDQVLVVWMTQDVDLTTDGVYHVVGDLDLSDKTGITNTDNKKAAATIHVKAELQIQDIVRVEALDGIKVKEGTDASEMVSKLPRYVTAILEDESTRRIGVIWDDIGDRLETAGTFELLGELDLQGKQDVTNSQGIKAQIEVIVTANPVGPIEPPVDPDDQEKPNADKAIKAITQPARKVVRYGTLKGNLYLPQQLEVILEDDSVQMIHVTWECDNYNPNKNGTYVFTGTLASVEGITNSNGIEISMEVYVKAKYIPNSSSDDTSSTPSISDTTTKDEPKDEPKDEVKEEPKDEVKEEPKEDEVISKVELPVVRDMPKFSDVKQTDWYEKAVRFVYERNIMNGVSINDFAPSAQVTRGMAVTVLYNLANKPSVTISNEFEDVDAHKWYASPVAWAKVNNITRGITDTQFGPNQNVTREQIATFFYNYAKALGCDMSVDSDELAVYTDKPSAWATNAMAWAVKNGIISGKDKDTLDAKGSATRAELAMISMRFYNTFIK